VANDTLASNVHSTHFAQDTPSAHSEPNNQYEHETPFLSVPHVAEMASIIQSAQMEPYDLEWAALFIERGARKYFINGHRNEHR
jgi:hypothetical protein